MNKVFRVMFEYVENNDGPYLEPKYVTAKNISEAVAAAQVNVPENQRVTGVNEEGVVIE